uniref:Uncharacterized protein n=1 Tax=Glossina pallidipes TaxID=7398 RepID=A0A1B0A7Q5_GLOPL
MMFSESNVDKYFGVLQLTSKLRCVANSGSPYTDHNKQSKGPLQTCAARISLDIDKYSGLQENNLSMSALVLSVFRLFPGLIIKGASVLITGILTISANLCSDLLNSMTAVGSHKEESWYA